MTDPDDRREAFMGARLFAGPRRGRIATGVLRKATHWDEVVAQLGHERLRRHDMEATLLGRGFPAGEVQDPNCGCDDPRMAAPRNRR
ncbi:hypothetical protein ACQP1G_14155 [Nocardia sp. CA-107356]|uniref:hypothetical protein n=1 Tax=Nocardia sp. CA-107356 TaxID=3239972 RepID=UPI003D8F2C3B